MTPPPNVRLELSPADDSVPVSLHDISHGCTGVVVHTANHVHTLSPNLITTKNTTRERKTLRVEFAAMDDLERNSIRKDLDSSESHDFAKFKNNSRYRGHRLSLLGKPINYKTHRKDIRLRRAQAKLYNFLERPKDWLSVCYHLFVFLMVFLCLLFSVFSTIDTYESVAGKVLFHMEIFMVIWFTVEFSLRIWSAGCRSRYQDRSGRWRFLKRPLCIVDCVVILAGIIAIGLGSSGQMFAASALRGLRFFQILRMVRVDRRGGSWKLLGSVIWAHRQEMFTTLYIGFLVLIFSSFLVYLVEKDENDKFKTYADALWWGVITLCTVGYGDTVPETWAGKLIAAFCALCGISFFALPAGILGSGFALKVQQHQREKHLIRRRVPAATLIQCLWRCYAADEHSMSVATWKIHLKPCRSPAQVENSNKFKHNSSFVSRFSSRRRRYDQPNSPRNAHPTLRKTNTSDGVESASQIHDSSEALHRSHVSLAMGEHTPVTKENSVSSLARKESEATNHKKDDLDHYQDGGPQGGVTQLTEQHKRAIRSIRKIKYFVSRRKFKEALRPYDVKDVIEQYSAGHVDMLGRIKHLQARLDQILGKAGTKTWDVYDSKVSLASHIVKVERQVDDVENKIDLLLDMYKEDRKLLLAHNQELQSLRHRAPHYQLQVPGTTPSPKPILVDKQNTSAPNTPIPRHPCRPMHRNLSDLGPRIKKRVTYRCLSDSSGLQRGAISHSQPKLAPVEVQVVNKTSGTPVPLEHVSECATDCEHVTDNESDGDSVRIPLISRETEPEPATLDIESREEGNGRGDLSPLFLTPNPTHDDASPTSVLMRPEIMNLRKSSC